MIVGWVGGYSGSSDGQWARLTVSHMRGTATQLPNSYTPCKGGPVWEDYTILFPGGDGVNFWIAFLLRL